MIIITGSDAWLSIAVLLFSLLSLGIVLGAWLMKR